MAWVSTESEASWHRECAPWGIQGYQDLFRVLVSGLVFRAQEIPGHALRQ